MRIAAWAWMAVLGAGTGHAWGVPFAERLAMYEAVDVADIVWGRESAAAVPVGVLDPPYLTADPGRVEVIEFVRYSGRIWQRSRPYTDAWRESLPPGVVVRRMPKGVTKSKRRHLMHDEWLLHQRVFFAGQLAGIEDEVHEAMAYRLGQAPSTLGSEYSVRRFAGGLGVDPAAFVGALDDPAVAARARQAMDTEWEWRLAPARAGAARHRKSLYPSLLIAGKWALSASALGGPGETYRIANRLIRLELERIEAQGRAHDGPTNDEELAAWLAPRSGEVFSRVRAGKRLAFRGVYNADRKEIWGLNDDGSFKDTSPLRGEGDDSYWHFVDPEKGERHLHLWMRALQYVSYETGEGRPQRYGAFLFTDWLSAPETLWVGLPFKGREAAMAFTPDGKVEARNDTGSLFGTWWLEAGNLNVSFGALGIQSWPWREAAAHVGFAVPERSLTPWRKETKRDWGGGE